MSWVVLLLEEVEAWYFDLDAEAMTAVTAPSTCSNKKAQPSAVRPRTR